jgi:hypothetical protein
MSKGIHCIMRNDKKNEIKQEILNSPFLACFLLSFYADGVLTESDFQKKILDKEIGINYTFGQWRMSSMYSMKYVIVIAAVLVVCLPAWGVESVPQEKQEKAVKSPWINIKKAATPIVANISEKYSDVSKAFSEYWNAIKERDYKKAYELESSAYRKATSFDLYKERLKRAVLITAIRPLEVKPVNEKEVMVKGSLAFKAGFMDTLRIFHDRWVKEASGWRHEPKEEKKG